MGSIDLCDIIRYGEEYYFNCSFHLFDLRYFAISTKLSDLDTFTNRIVRPISSPFIRISCSNLSILVKFIAII